MNAVSGPCESGAPLAADAAACPPPEVVVAPVAGVAAWAVTPVVAVLDGVAPCEAVVIVVGPLCPGIRILPVAFTTCAPAG